ncbi:MAG: response regulator [Planctomycetes bacterium]|nr:response regulator [Planctomycetota bacterium]
MHTPPIKQILLVGHCGADTGTLSHVLSRAAAGVAVAGVNDGAALDRLAKPGTLLLVNRVLDGRFTDADGVALIRRVRSRPDAPAAMLISNYADAQESAREAGALPGFGKSQAWDDRTVEMLRRVIGGRG